MLEAFGQQVGQGWVQIADLFLAFALSSCIGLEREVRQKSAGMRTHTLVGVGSALIVLVSKYGFTDVLGTHESLDPSRVAAQIVSGIGFIGAGLIFVHRGAVSGLTTAAAVWLTAAVGMAAGADLPLLAGLTTAAYFLVVFGYTPLVNRLPGSKYLPSGLTISYRGGHGVLRAALNECTDRGFVVRHFTGGRDEQDGRMDGTVSVRLQVQGKGSITELAAALSELDGVVHVDAEEVGVSPG